MPASGILQAGGSQTAAGIRTTWRGSSGIQHSFQYSPGPGSANLKSDELLFLTLGTITSLTGLRGGKGLGSNDRTKRGRSAEWTGKYQGGETLETGGQRLVSTEHNWYPKAELDKQRKCHTRGMVRAAAGNRFEVG